MAKLDDLSSNEIASLLGMTARNVRRLVDEGAIPSTKQGNSLRFDGTEAVPAYIEYATHRATTGRGATTGELEKQRLEEEVRLKRAKAAQEEMKLGELDGNLHRSEDVEEALDGLVYAVRSNLMALPGRVAMDAYGAKSAAEVSQIMEREVESILRDLAGYQYDPRWFAERVRDREGWREVMGREPSEREAERAGIGDD